MSLFSRYWLQIILLLWACLFSATAIPFERLFYANDQLSLYSIGNEKYLDEIERHANRIDVIAPQVFQFDQSGMVWGSIDERVLNFAKKHRIKVMPLMVNTEFDQHTLHAFLLNQKAQQRLIERLIELANQYKLYGFQFDIENVSFIDRDRLTRFVAMATKALHEHGYKLSVAVIAEYSSEKYTSDYDNYMHENWSGAYDIVALAGVCDFVTVMAYDRNTSMTTPGPVAPFPWVENIITQLLKKIPANKISLGIPVYSGYWRTGTLHGYFQPVEYQISYMDTKDLLERFNVKPQWNKQTRTPFSLIYRDGAMQYLFINNARTFEQSVELAKRLKLRGISVWRLTLEDPALWNLHF